MEPQDFAQTGSEDAIDDAVTGKENEAQPKPCTLPDYSGRRSAVQTSRLDRISQVSPSDPSSIHLQSASG
jgi:hypothetical protein